MRILWGQDLVDELHRLANEVRKRLWVASPFVGTWENVQAILGTSWYNRPGVSVRLLTDTSGSTQYLNRETLLHFRKKGEIRNIPGLHAKIYIADDSALVTSANLTGMAFKSRFEVGVRLSNQESLEVINLYEHWWRKQAEGVPADWAPRAKRRTSADSEEEPYGKGLVSRWKLPPVPATRGAVPPSPMQPAPKPRNSKHAKRGDRWEFLAPQDLDEIRRRFPNWRKRMGLLDVLRRDWTSRNRLDGMHSRGKTALTAKNYKDDYTLWAIENMNKNFLKEGLPFRIAGRGDQYRLVKKRM